MFDSSGGFLAKWRSAEPWSIAIDAGSNVYVWDSYDRSVRKYTSSGAFVKEWEGFVPFLARLDGGGLATNSRGSVYVTGNSGVWKFTGDGLFQARYQYTNLVDGQFNLPHGVAVNGSNDVYVADTYNNQIQKFDRSGAFVSRWGRSGDADGEMNLPWAVAVDSSARVYVADTLNHRIQVFDGSGGFLAQWGSYGSGDGQFSHPVGVAVDTSGNVYVADMYNNRIQKFDSSGGFLAKWSSAEPWAIAIDASGNVYVADDSWNRRIQKYDSSGGLLASLGSGGSGDGQFDYPEGVGVDQAGRLYVTEGRWRSDLRLFNRRVQQFDAGGTFLAKWGRQGSGAKQFYDPWGIAFDSRGDIYVADANNNRIQKFVGVTLCTAVVDGNWSSRATWDCGVVPSVDDSVVIPAGRTVTLDVDTADLLHVTLQGALQHNDSPHTLSLTGNWSNTGTFDPGVFMTVHISVQPQGLRTAQTLAGDTTFYELSVGDGCRLHTDGTVAVVGALAHGAGSVIRESRPITENTTYNFSLAGASIHFADRGGVASLAVSRTESPHPQENIGGEGPHILDHFYTLTASANPAQADVCFSYSDAEVAGLVEDSLRLCRWTGSAWNCLERGRAAAPPPTSCAPTV